MGGYVGKITAFCHLLNLFSIVWGFRGQCISRVKFKEGGGLVVWAIVRYCSTKIGERKREATLSAFTIESVFDCVRIIEAFQLLD